MKMRGFFLYRLQCARARVHLVEAGICGPRLSIITRLADALQVEAIKLLTEKN